MKNVPDIAPEIRGLLEEIVADPRSSIRLVPRKALRSWFDSGETVRPREVSSTRAERHLIEEHREALAELLCEAAWIAYWKAPVLAHKPVGSDGKLYDPALREPEWRSRAIKRIARSPEAPEGVALLRGCIAGQNTSEDASRLAQASLRLVPCDRTRCYVALTLPWTSPRSAIGLLAPLALNARPATLRSSALLSLAARTCALGKQEEARDLYRTHYRNDPLSYQARICVLNLSCLLGDPASALKEARELGSLVDAGDEQVLEERDLLRKWWSTRQEAEVLTARKVAAGISNSVPDVAKVLFQSFGS